MCLFFCDLRASDNCLFIFNLGFASCVLFYWPQAKDINQPTRDALVLAPYLVFWKINFIPIVTKKKET